MRLATISNGQDLPLDADDEDQLGLGGDVEGAILLGSASEANLLALVVAVLLDVLLGTLEDDATLLLVGLEDMSARFCAMPHCVCGARNPPQSSIRPERWLSLATALTEV